MLDRIDVCKLFGVFDHSITLKDEGVTIILGENGLGKTVILKIIKFFFDHNFEELGNYEFENILFHFKNGLLLKITKLYTDDSRILHFELNKGSEDLQQYDYRISSSNINRRRPKHYGGKYSKQLGLFYRDERLGYDFDIDELLLKYLPSSVRMDAPNFWFDLHTNAYYDTSDLIERYKMHFPSNIRDFLLSQFNTDVPNWLITLTGPVNAKLVETQRLLISLEEDKYRNTVLRFSSQLVEMIKERRSVATDLASKLDRTYTNRLIDKFSVESVRGDLMLDEGLTNLQIEREFLNDVGLLDIDEEYIQPINNIIFDKPELKGVLQIYIEDSTQKLSIYNELGKKIKIFLDIINKRFKNKKLTINKNLGFEFKSKIIDKQIPLSGLSSGEQHLIVLFFELIFNTDEQSMLLIDEPEISLHITWQKEFIQDLREIIKLNNLNVVIATHSPDIIGNFWNLTTSLKYENAQ